MIYQLAVILLVITSLTMGIVTGILVERVRWNKLIHGGRLPKPFEGEIYVQET